MSINLLQSNDDVNEARANIFSALGDPTRLRIFQTLVESDEPLNVSELCDRTGLGTNLVSHHLQCLKNCQLVDAERDGRKKYYEVSRPEAVEMLSLADDCIRQNIESVLGCEVVTEAETDER
ncbi:metalloregulator ArsR/SmtB family transcription factor (plasmid) [Halorussus limi]|uniref:Metalloregulator ArsR/SmtB family transcription factor n=1 Tax=Halorussus limi TaxID=2938695 RepID=A0A8U0I1B4_9EURY|nr:metalloregulator ArsR/SmtB family transcription factor [Halorussus limi]UPV76969.1 metalloregulator ArsR/SmtB family transcription factor [Halorussus limi]